MIFGEVRAQKSPKMVHFMDAASPWKHWKIYHLTTINSIKMKLTTILYIHKNIYLGKNLGVAHRVPEDVVEEPLKKSQKIGFLALFPRIFKTTSKTVTYMMPYLALHYWWNFCTNWSWFGVIIYKKPPKSSQKSYFLLVRETYITYIYNLKIYNLTTTNAIPMKFTRVMYLHETFHLAKNWSVTHRSKEGVV